MGEPAQAACYAFDANEKGGMARLPQRGQFAGVPSRLYVSLEWKNKNGLLDQASEQEFHCGFLRLGLRDQLRVMNQLGIPYVQKLATLLLGRSAAPPHIAECPPFQSAIVARSAAIAHDKTVEPACARLALSGAPDLQGVALEQARAGGTPGASSS